MHELPFIFIFTFAPIVPFLADAGIRIGGGILSRIIGGKRKEVDLTTPAINASQAELSDLASEQRLAAKQLEGDLARIGSAGFSGAAARQNLLTANARAGATIRGGILDTIARARQQENILNTDAANQERLNTIQGINEAAGAVGGGVNQLLGSKNLLEQATKLVQASQPSVGQVAPQFTPTLEDTSLLNPQLQQLPAAQISTQPVSAISSLEPMTRVFQAQSALPGFYGGYDYNNLSKRIFNSLQTVQR